MKTKLHSQRGSALLVALVITAGMMAMVGSYLSLVSFNLKSSHRSYHSSAAMNLAETGLEEGMWAINQRRAGNAAAFAAPWVVSGDEATLDLNNVISVSTATSTRVQVKVTNCNLTLSTRPRIKAHAVLALPAGMPSVDKWVEVTLDAPATGTPSQPGPSHPGLVAKQSIRFNGNNPSVDSWNSDPLKTGVSNIKYSNTTRNDKGFVGSIDVAVDQVLVQNADILGNVATHNDTNLNNNVGSNGSVLAFDSPSGTKIDPRRVSTDFKASLPDVTAPATAGYTIGAVNSTTDLPRAGDTAAADGKYYYTISGISLSSSEKLNILSGNVVINVSSAYQVKLSGQAELNIMNGASLDLYAGGDVDLTGQGVSNGTQPATGTHTAATMQAPIKFKLFGTAPTTAVVPQSIKIAGKGALSGVVYAPNANITINGNGDVQGSVVGKNITLTGNAAFHYDESLGQFAFGTPSDSGESPLTIYRWRELTDPSERTFTASTL
jgi:hypothetical protein